MLYKPIVPVPPVALFALSLLAGGYFLNVSWLVVAGIALPLYLAVYSLWPLLWNINESRKSGAPYVVAPIHQGHILWIVFGAVSGPTLRKILPSFLYDRLNLFIMGWEINDSDEMYDKFAAPYGHPKSLIMVGCDRAEMTTRDPEVVSQVLTRINDFVIEDGTYQVLSHFGQNVFTTTGAAWTNQRKIIASTINERLSRALFDETLRQSEGLLHEVFRGQEKTKLVAETNALFDMMKKITINVLNGVGIGRSVAWDDREQDAPRPGYQYTFIQSAKLVMDALGGPLLIPGWIIHNYPKFMPGHEYMLKMSTAIKEYPQHTMHIVNQEHDRMKMAKKDEAAKSNVVSLLLQASRDEGGAGKGKSLTDSEIVGNLFVFTAAGFETTANTLSFALMMLVRYPEWQAWLFEEIDALTPDGEDGIAELEYTSVHPKAQRIMAFMYETLRFYPALIHISKQAVSPQIIQTSTHSYRIPTWMNIRMNAVALHMDPAVWRNLNIHQEWHEQPSNDDERRFRPSRWVDHKDKPGALFTPPKGSYVPWSMGPRVCPGMKMAQVEFVAAILMLLRRHRLETVERPGESQQDVMKRLDGLLAKRMPVMTMLIADLYDPKTEHDGLKLRLVKRR